jgi:hypothetical protein
MARIRTGNPVGAPVLEPGEKDGRKRNGGARSGAGLKQGATRVVAKPLRPRNAAVQLKADAFDASAASAAPAAVPPVPQVPNAATSRAVAEVIASFPVKAGPAGLAAAIGPFVPKAINRLMELVDSKNEAIALEASQEVLNRVAGLPVRVVASTADLTPSKEPERITFSRYRARLERSMPGIFKRPLNDADHATIDRMMDRLQPGLSADGNLFFVDDRIEQE